ncbi:hypothetical protein FDP41_004887 [Naegleria fowleri]|uniref:3-oxo-5-alpha-steroid 4-dehydrogenase C-terminal domain-containing protein n=1 Tax=Naegleria fowleri TaxID=5763 RepID=A0A6A5BMV3_NAEFO|nr:uncharacterized protein FDP41_004887 [Naegleria fowleri]KAF0976212.1 hypothetical protein FDP41_004887 [Naegleria fowleri]CAG4715238.1 unnamed protein product [Naegleria fowleri]
MVLLSTTLALDVLQSFLYALIGPFGAYANPFGFSTFDLYLMSLFFIMFCPMSVIPLLFLGVRAPYGKFALTNAKDENKGLEGSSFNRAAMNFYSKFDLVVTNGKLAFAFQETFSLVLFFYAFYAYAPSIDVLMNSGSMVTIQQVIASLMFVLHYIHRAFIFTLVRTHSMSPSSLSIVMMAASFCAANGYLNSKGIWVYHDGTQTSNSDFSLMQFVVMALGVVFYVVGFYINYQSDEILIRLRTQNDHPVDIGATTTCGSKKKYFIPYGGLYSLVSSPNYFGEFIEWFGYFMFIQNRFAFLFVILTLSNLLPRAMQTHNWYLEKFGLEYRKLNRKAFIPYLL